LLSLSQAPPAILIKHFAEKVTEMAMGKGITIYDACYVALALIERG